MNRKLILAIALVAVAAASIYWFTRPASFQMPDVEPMTDASYQEMLEDMRRMTPEGENGRWSAGQIQWLRVACAAHAERQAAATNFQAGTADINAMCADIQ